MGIVYKTINLINGIIYIGKDSKNDSKYLGSGKHFLRALNKYGKENFNKIIIDIDGNKQELKEKEIFWIRFYDSTNPEIGYNLAWGGEGGSYGPMSEEQKRKLSIANKGKHWKLSEKTKQAMRKPKSEEHRRKLAEGLSSRPNPMEGKTHTEKTKNKIGAFQKGRPKSEKTRIRMSTAAKELWARRKQSAWHTKSDYSED
jgi:group I intron endonuclease